MSASTVHSPDQYIADLRQVLSQGRKRIGLFVGAGAPTSIRVDQAGLVAEHGRPLISDAKGLTKRVIDALAPCDRGVVDALTHDMDGVPNIEAILTKTRRLAQAIGSNKVYGFDADAYDQVGQRLCSAIGDEVGPRLPTGPSPYADMVSWIAGTQRTHSIEIFTPNYDLLIEEAFERARLPFYDGFTGSHEPFFDSVSVLSDELPSRWTRLWKLHGSLGWRISGNTVIRTGNRTATELIYPEHLKYDQVTRLPYSALFERLRRFLKTPDTLLLCSGFSFSDSHICAVMDESLAENPHTAIIAFQYCRLSNEETAANIAQSRPNMSVYARDRAVINGVSGPWRLGHAATGDWQSVRSTFWGSFSDDEPEAFLLGDFAILARFLALIRARMVSGNGDANENDHEGDRRSHAQVSYDA